MIEYLDESIGRIVDYLDQTGELDNTVIIVTADHGMPFPRVKGYAYHDSNHIPLAIRWPGGIGTPDELRASVEPEVKQFINGEPDGPVKFHYPAEPIEEELGVGG